MASDDLITSKNYVKLYADFNSRHPELENGRPCFRLLQIHEAKDDDGESDIKCTLHAANLQSPPGDWSALSYTREFPVEEGDDEGWEDTSNGGSEAGDNADSGGLADITVNELQVAIPTSLKDALRLIRNEKTVRYVWVDILCINHSSVSDRNAQISRMGDIYKQASFSPSPLIAWLGEEDATTGKGIVEVQNLSANKHLGEEYFSLNDQAETSSRLDSLACVLKKPWFDGIWLPQEVISSRLCDIRIGGSSIKLETFMNAARSFLKHEQSCCAGAVSRLASTLRDGADHVSDIRYGLTNLNLIDKIQQEDCSLHQVLRYFHNRLSKDPRDKVYALLSLVKPDERLVKLDYGIEAPEIYKNITTQVIQRSKNLSIFMDIDEAAGDIDVPYWCVDWTNASVFGHEHWDHFKAAGKFAAEIELCTPNTINIEGIIVDLISEVAPDVDDDGNDEEQVDLKAISDLLCAWEKVANLGETANHEYPSGGTRGQAFCETVMMGLKPDQSALLTDTDREGYASWRTLLSLCSTMPSAQAAGLLGAGMRNDAIRAFNGLVQGYISTRKFFETEDGYFGLGPRKMEEDDMVCVLAGGNMPFVLRAVADDCDICDSDQSRCQLLGFTYVHGIMNGEAVKSIEAEEQRWRKFCLQ